MISADVFIVGRGLAGTLLSWFLAKENFRVVLFSDEAPSASHVAAGVLHPVTGRRLAKSWMAEVFIPFAEQTYADCETASGKVFYAQKDIVELLRDASEYNDWMTAASSDTLAAYVNPPDRFAENALQPFPYAARVKGGCLDTRTFLDAMQEVLVKRCTVVREAVDARAFVTTEDSVEYGKFRAKHIVFCEGYRGQSNPYWKNLPWQLSKGELLTIRCPGLKGQHIYNRKVTVAPAGNDLYRVGSTYAWDDLNDFPTAEARQKLVAALEKILKVPFEVTEQAAAIRPTVKERRPFLGFHPVFHRVGIFNGLGTKGAMSAPWLAHHLAEHLKTGLALLPETTVQRYIQQLAT